MNKKTIRTLLNKWNTSSHDYSCQIYGIITPRKHGEFSLVCYAIKETKRHGIQMTEVNRAWSDRPYYQCKNIWKNVWGSTMVEFDERKNRPQESYGWYAGKWGAKMKWSEGEEWFMPYVKYLNIDALSETKYKYCAYDQYIRNPVANLSLIAYCRILDEFKEVEILSKNGLQQFIERRFLAQCRKDKQLRNFFRSNAKDLMWTKYRPFEIIRANRNGWSIQEAREAEIIRYSYKDAPKGVDKTALHKYLSTNNIDYLDWKHYAEDVEESHGDILAYGTTFPKDFHNAVKRTHRKVETIRRKKRAEYEAQRREMEKKAEAALKRLTEKINRSLERMANRLAWRVGEYTVIIPTTASEFREEGKAMQNCIGGYFDRCAHGETFCFFIRKNGKRLADVEMNPKSGDVRQCRAKLNAQTDDITMDFAKIMAKKFATSLKVRKAA